MSAEAKPAVAMAAAPTAARPQLLGFVLVVLLMLGWGLHWPASKVALQEFHPLVQRGLALFFGGLGLLALARALGHSLKVRIDEIAPLALVTVFHVTGWHVLVAYGLSMMPAGRASIIGNTIPLWVLVIGFLALRQPLPRPRVLGIVLGVAGILVLIGPDLARLGSAPLGSVLMLVAAVCAGAGSVAMKAFTWKTPLTVLTGWSVLLGGVPLYLAAWVTGAGLLVPEPSWPAIIGVLYTIVVATIFCHWCWFKIVVLFPPAVGAAASFGVPIVGVFSSALLLGDPLGLQEIGALLLVLGGLALVFYLRPTRPPAERAPVEPTGDAPASPARIEAKDSV
jgi:drug/metabolite transporter (DMT)-like permease